MKKKRQEKRAIFILCLAIGWWGFWYPELERIADTYAIVLEDGTIQKSSEMLEWELGGYSHWDLSKVDSSQVKVSSKLWKFLQEYWEEDRSEG